MIWLPSAEDLPTCTRDFDCCSSDIDCSRRIEPDLRRPSEWEKELGISILDPDGWREARIRWDSLIDKTTFKALAATSTAGPRKSPPEVDLVTQGLDVLQGLRDQSERSFGHDQHLQAIRTTALTVAAMPFHGTAARMSSSEDQILITAERYVHWIKTGES